MEFLELSSEKFAIQSRLPIFTIYVCKYVDSQHLHSKRFATNETSFFLPSVVDESLAIAVLTPIWLKSKKRTDEQSTNKYYFTDSIVIERFWSDALLFVAAVEPTRYSLMGVSLFINCLLNHDHHVAEGRIVERFTWCHIKISTKHCHAVIRQQLKVANHLNLRFTRY